MSGEGCGVACQGRALGSLGVGRRNMGDYWTSAVENVKMFRARQFPALAMLTSLRYQVFGIY